MGQTLFGFGLVTTANMTASLLVAGSKESMGMPVVQDGSHQGTGWRSYTAPFRNRLEIR